MAFYDKKNEPSVDRACIHNDPSKTQGDVGNGVIKLLAGNVRDIDIDYHKSRLIFLKSTQKSVSIYGLSIRGYENAKKY